MNTAVLLLALAPLIQPSPPDPRLTELVRQLGHRDFKTREAAASELVRKGIDVVPALIVGTKDTDPEIAGRCKQLLPVAFSWKLNNLLRQLTEEPLGPLPIVLAGLERFIAITGDSKESCQLYADMMTEHHEIIEAFDKDPKTGSRLLNEACKKLREQWEQNDLNELFGMPNLSDDLKLAPLVLFLFIRGDTRFVEDSEINFGGEQILKILHLSFYLARDKEFLGVKKHFLEWMQNEKNSSLVHSTFEIIQRLKLTEAIPNIIKLASDRHQREYIRLGSLYALSKIGDAGNIKDLKRFLTDESIMKSWKTDEGESRTFQFRDLALGVTLQFSGQRLDHFHYDTEYLRDGIPARNLGYYAYTFANEIARDAAFAKWKEFTSKPENKRQEP